MESTLQKPAFVAAGVAKRSPASVSASLRPTWRSSRNGSGWELQCGLNDGIIAVGNAHKDKLKLTFSHGAGLPDPDKLFNAGLGGNGWRVIDLFEGDKINERALRNLVRAAVDYNQIKLQRKAPAVTRAKVHKSKK